MGSVMFFVPAAREDLTLSRPTLSCCNSLTVFEDRVAWPTPYRRLLHLGWLATLTTDCDGDGCRDATEDPDDDGDGVLDSSDLCTCEFGVAIIPEPDVDGDGCSDDGDPDSDGDGLPDSVDDCPMGESGWTSGPFTDCDRDGCRDAGEDTDDDNDGVADGSDIDSLDPEVCEDSDSDSCDDCSVGTDGLGPLAS